jgi:hypothetical protein
MSHKRSASSSCATSEEKRTASPPALPDPRDVAEDLDAWDQYSHDLQGIVERAENLVKEAELRRLAEMVATERNAPGYDARTAHLFARNLIWCEEDPDWTDGLFKHDTECAGCNSMTETWTREAVLKYGVEPRWRIRGTDRFLCVRCRARVLRGERFALLVAQRT